jgi:uncharacterized membrane protein YbaN (DUF454 family)
MKADKNTFIRLLRHISKPVWNIAGSVFVALGVIGIFVPLLPTTVFLLLGAACYNNGSERFHHWLINNRVLGPYIANFRHNKGIPLQAKVKAIAVLWVTIGVSIYFISNLYITLILILVAVGVSLFLITRKTLKI